MNLEIERWQQTFLCQWLDVGGKCFAERLCKPKSIYINTTLTWHKGDRNGTGINQYSQGNQSRAEYGQGKVRPPDQKRGDRPHGGGVPRQPPGTAAEEGVCEEGTQDHERAGYPYWYHRRLSEALRTAKYQISIRQKVDKTLEKLFLRNRTRWERVFSKVIEILQNPQHYKNLRGPLKDWKRVHIDRSFVLMFSVDENSKTVIVQDLEHHDRAY